MSTSHTPHHTTTWYHIGVALGWIALALFLLFVFTDIDTYIAYVAYERDWHFIAWLFSRSYPEL